MSPLPRGAAQPPDEYDLLVQDEQRPAYVPASPHEPRDADTESAPVTADVDQPGSGAEDDEATGTVYLSLPGMPGRGVVLATAVITAACAMLDLTLTGGLSIFFDQCFVVICLVAAMAVRRIDIFVVGVMPPLVFALVIAALAVAAPAGLAPSGGLGQLFLLGLTAHATGLLAGYGVALLTIGARVLTSRQG